METSTTQKADLSPLLGKIVPVAQMIMEEAMKAGGLGLTSSLRESEAVAKYMHLSETTYKGNPLVEGIIGEFSHMRGQHRQKIDINKLDSSKVMKSVDEVVPLLDNEGIAGTQTKSFLYGLGESIAGSSGRHMFSSKQTETEEEKIFLADLKTHLNI